MGSVSIGPVLKEGFQTGKTDWSGGFVPWVEFLPSLDIVSAKFDYI